MNVGLNLMRFFLASNVVAFHLWNAAAPGAGPVAVMGFFFTSGFLVTQIVQEVYATPQSIGPFLVNRSLRIFPQYLAALGLGLLTIALYPAVASHINSYLRWPVNAQEWIAQLTVFGLIDSNVRVLPAAWTLGTELYFYLLIGLLTGRSRIAAIALCLVSMATGGLCGLGVVTCRFYGSAMGNGFVLALGSLAYFYRQKIRVGPTLFSVAVAAYLANLYLVPALEQTDLDRMNLTASVLPFAVIFLFLVQHPLRRGTALAALADKLGKIAYPMFLLHWAVCVLLSAWLFHGQGADDATGPPQGAMYFAAMFLAVLACSMAFHLLIDRPIEHYRKIIRDKATRT